MLIGSGESQNTDNDVLLGADGLPFIPGTTIAGMLRNLTGADEEDTLFGTIRNAQTDSALYIYDALFDMANTLHLSERDNVSLDEYKTAKDSLKFDYEVVEPPTVFRGLIEIRGNDSGRPSAKGGGETVQQAAERILQRITADGCSFGAKKSRGLGKCSVTVLKKEFSLEDEDGRTQWLEFEPFEEGAFEQSEELKPSACLDDDRLKIEIGLEQRGGISIRTYTTDVGGVDYRTLRYEAEEYTDKAVIPGTSWAGAFRQRVTEYVGAEKVKSLFGHVEVRDRIHPAQESEGKAAWQSLVRFDDTVLSRGTTKTITRNAIDRFSGKVKDGALYSEQTYFGGTGILTITITLKEGMEEVRQAFGAAICDLYHGFLCVGGLTAVGRGLFNVISIDVNKTVLPLGEKWENRLIALMKEPKAELEKLRKKPATEGENHG